jgi:hypothetical protein
MHIHQLINCYNGNDWVMPKAEPGGFRGFPAVSLPSLRFLQRFVAKHMILRVFWAQGEPRKIFYPELSRAAGKDRGFYEAAPEKDGAHATGRDVMEG